MTDLAADFRHHLAEIAFQTRRYASISARLRVAHDDLLGIRLCGEPLDRPPFPAIPSTWSREQVAQAVADELTEILDLIDLDGSAHDLHLVVAAALIPIQKEKPR